jgi:hypothetical protein
MSDEQYISGQGTVTPEPAALEVGMTEADFSSKYLGVGGAWCHHSQRPALNQLVWGNNQKQPDSHEDACMH